MTKELKSKSEVTHIRYDNFNKILGYFCKGFFTIFDFITGNYSEIDIKEDVKQIYFISEEYIAIQFANESICILKCRKKGAIIII